MNHSHAGFCLVCAKATGNPDYKYCQKHSIAYYCKKCRKPMYDNVKWCEQCLKNRIDEKLDVIAGIRIRNQLFHRTDEEEIYEEKTPKEKIIKTPIGKQCVRCSTIFFGPSEKKLCELCLVERRDKANALEKFVKEAGLPEGVTKVKDGYNLLIKKYDTLKELQYKIYLTALYENYYNNTRTAMQLEVSIRTLRNFLIKHKIQRKPRG